MKKEEKDLLKLAKDVSGKSTREIAGNVIKQNANNKGQLGNLIQEYVFSIKPNSKSEPDFKTIGIDMELKVTPVKKLKRKTDIYSAKERLSIMKINYFELPENFYESHLYNKMKKMLIMTYLYEKGKKNIDYKFINSYIFDFNELPKNEVETILNDYKIIYNKVKNGLAHEISSRDTIILEANRKGSGNKKSNEKLVKQPSSQEEAFNRGFSLKNSYMTLLFYRSLDNLEINFDQYISQIYMDIYDYLKQFIGKDLNKYDEKKSNAKNRNGNTIRRLVKNWDEDAYEMLKKQEIKLRTMILKENSQLQESLPISTNYIVKDEIINEIDFENSRFYKELTTPYILVTIDEKNDKRLINNIYLIENFLINETYYKNSKKVWQDTKNFFVHLDKDPTYNKQNKLIGLADNLYFHVRSKAKDGSINYDKTNLTRQAFWINNKELQKIINNYNKK